MKKFILLICILFLAPSAHAQYVDLSISPPVVEVLISPNKKATQTFTLQTQGDNISIIPEIHRVTPSDSNGHVNIDPAVLNPSTIPLTVTSPSHPLGEPIAVTGPNLPITLSFEAANVDIAQDFYLALVLRANQGDTPQKASTTTPAISALILVTINPTGVMPINIEVKDFTTPFFHDSWLPLTISPSLDNKVPIMIRPEGKYEIVSPSGKTTFSLNLYPSLVLGNSTRTIQASSNSDPCQESQGSELCLPTPLTWSPKWSDIGPHRLHLIITTQGGTKLTDVEKIIWVLPIRIIVIATLFIILIIIFLATRNNSSPKLPIDNTFTTR